MRIFSAALALALAGCGAEPANEGSPISCAIGGGDSFAADCSVEQYQGPDGTLLTIRHPDGGFRRMLIAGDGRGVVAADGAETAIVTPVDAGMIEVRLGDARYRLPATVKGAK